MKANKVASRAGLSLPGTWLWQRSWVGKHVGPQVPVGLGYSKAERERGAHAEPLDRSRPVPGPHPALTAASAGNSAAKGLAQAVCDVGRVDPHNGLSIHCDLPATKGAFNLE